MFVYAINIIRYKSLILRKLSLPRSIFLVITPVFFKFTYKLNDAPLKSSDLKSHFRSIYTQGYMGFIHCYLPKMSSYQCPNCTSFQNIVNHDTFGYIRENNEEKPSLVVETFGYNLQMLRDSLILTLEHIRRIKKSVPQPLEELCSLLPYGKHHSKRSQSYKGYSKGLSGQTFCLDFWKATHP